MSETIGPFKGVLGTPSSNLAGGSTSTAPTPAPTVVPSGAAGPVWQPWVETHANAQSKLKTQINVALVAFNRDMASAQRLLDAAESIAATEVKQLEAAAWSAWHKYMQEAANTHDAVMKPALAAFDAAAEQARARADTLIYHANAAYVQAKGIAVYGRDQAIGSDTFGTG